MTPSRSVVNIFYERSLTFLCHSPSPWNGSLGSLTYSKKHEINSWVELTEFPPINYLTKKPIFYIWKEKVVVKVSSFSYEINAEDSHLAGNFFRKYFWLSLHRYIISFILRNKGCWFLSKIICHNVHKRPPEARWSLDTGLKSFE